MPCAARNIFNRYKTRAKLVLSCFLCAMLYYCQFFRRQVCISVKVSDMGYDRIEVRGVVLCVVNQLSTF